MGSGDDKEREFQNFVYDVSEKAGKSYVAIRFPGSGSNPRHEMPDLFVRIEGKWYAIEHKYTSGDYARFPQSQIEQLLAFAEDADAEPWLASRFSQYRRQFFLTKAKPFYEKLRKSDDKSASMKRANMDQYRQLEDFFDVDFDPEECR